MRLRSIALAGAALISLCGPAAAGQGWYIGAEVGKSRPVDTKWKFPELPSVTGNVNADSSVLFGGVVGFKIPDGLRIEFEASHVSYDFDPVTIGNSAFSASGDLSETILFGNLIYDLPIARRWAVSLGGGIGGGWVKPDATVNSSPDNHVFRQRGRVRLAVDRGPCLFGHPATRCVGRLSLPLGRHDRSRMGFRHAADAPCASATRTATRCCSAFATSSSRPCHPRHLRRCSRCRRRRLRRRLRRRCRLRRRRCLRRRHLPHRLHRRRPWRRSSCSSTSTASI